MTYNAFSEQYKYDPDKDLLGSGGFGTVYRARDSVNNRYVAIKISQVKDIFGKFTLLNEVELSKKIDDHANVARYEFGLRVKLPFPVDYAVMAYYEEGNLDMLLRKRFGQLTDKEYYEIVEGLLEGIGHLHNEDVIHRDLKLANILMFRTRQGQWRPKIADFGLSRQVDSSESVISENSAIGITIAYASPEQIEAKPIRKNVDLWAIGVIIYRLLTGEMPFAAAEIRDVTSANLEISRKITRVELPEKLNTIPQPYQEIIRLCFVKDTKDRVQTAYELLDVLKRFRPDSNSQAKLLLTPTVIPSFGEKPVSQSSASFNKPSLKIPPSVSEPVLADTPTSLDVFSEESATFIEPSYEPSYEPKPVLPSVVLEGETLIEPQSLPKIVALSDETVVEPAPISRKTKPVKIDKKEASLEKNALPKIKEGLSKKNKIVIGSSLVCLLLSFSICKMVKPNELSPSGSATETITAPVESNVTVSSGSTATNTPLATAPTNTSTKPIIGVEAKKTPTVQVPTTATVVQPATQPVVNQPYTQPVVTQPSTPSVIVEPKPPTTTTTTTTKQPAPIEHPTPPVESKPIVESKPPVESKPIAVAPTLSKQARNIFGEFKCKQCCSEFAQHGTITINNFAVESDGSITLNGFSFVSGNNSECKKGLLEAFKNKYKFSPPKNGRYEFKNFSITF